MKLKPKNLTTAELNANIIQFVKNAFVIDGTVELVHKSMEFDCYIKCNDKKRGTFCVAWQFTFDGSGNNE